jgi:DNA-directed RNA polymerase subunit RPC12/RpoP
MSFLAMQRFFDQVNRSIYRCPDCGWRGRGRDLAAMEQDGQDAFTTDSDSWYACPTCEYEIALDAPLMRLVSAAPQAESAADGVPIDIESTGSIWAD